MEVKKVLVIYMQRGDETLKVVEDTLSKYKCNYRSILRSKKRQEDFVDINLVITIGGDGTFLRTAPFINETPIFGVNSNIERKEGFFTRANKINFPTRFGKFLEDKHNIIKLHRLQAKLNNQQLEDTLNEVYVGTRLSYNMARYKLTVEGFTETQKSSGVLIGTAAGSYAWIKSCGGKILPLDSEKFQYIVREPYVGNLIKHTMVRGVLEKGCIRIKSQMDDGIVIIDSLSKEYNFNEGDVLTVEKSTKSLNVVGF